MNFAEYDQATYQQVLFDGYTYFPMKGNSLEDFLAVKKRSRTTAASTKDFTTAMHGEHWVWFSPTEIDKSLEILQIELAWLDQVSIYFLSKGGEYETYEAGDEYPFSQRVIDFRKPVFPLLREINQKEVETVALRISAQGRFSLPLFALSEKAFNAQVNLDYLFYGRLGSNTYCSWFLQRNNIFQFAPQRAFVLHHLCAGFYCSSNNCKRHWSAICLAK